MKGSYYSHASKGFSLHRIFSSWCHVSKFGKQLTTCPEKLSLWTCSGQIQDSTQVTIQLEVSPGQINSILLKVLSHL